MHSCQRHERSLIRDRCSKSSCPEDLCVSVRLTPEALSALDAAIDQAIDHCDTGHLEVLGYGEISAVIAWPPEHPTVACKRLPLFDDERSVLAYSTCIDDYLEALSVAGVAPLETAVQWIPHDDGRYVAYCIQPLQSAESMLNRHLGRCSPSDATTLFNGVMRRIEGCVTPKIGLDSQASNWIVTASGLAYLDVSTPLLRDSGGQERLDTEIFIASLPWALRGFVRRFLLGSILGKYYDFRGVVLDFLGNLHKEGLANLIPSLLQTANERVSPPISEAEIARYYRSDALMWEFLQRLRHVDRAWQRHIRRQQYPFLLPGKIDRNV